MSLETFRRYCEENQNYPQFDQLCSQQHDQLVSRIMNNPALVDLQRVDSKFKEVGLLSRSCALIGVIDLIFFLRDESVYICEVKASDRYGRGANEQLRKDYRFVANRFEIFPNRMSIAMHSGRGLRKTIIVPYIGDILKSIAKSTPRQA